MERVKIFYYKGHGSLDLVTDTYHCIIRKRGDVLRIYSKDSKYAQLILCPDSGFSEGLGKWELCNEPQVTYKEANSFSLTYNCEDGVISTVTFYNDRIEMKAVRTGKESVIPDKFYIGRGSKLFSDRIFTPSWPDCTLPIGHYMHRCEEVQLSPGLMSPAPWCFSCENEDGSWTGFSLEPTHEELDFLYFGSHSGVNNEYCWEVGYNGCRPACTDLSVPTLTFRFSLKDEFEVFCKHTQHLLDMGLTTLPDKTPEWHRGVSACGWRWQCGKMSLCTQELYQDNIKLFENCGLDCDIVIIDDFWGNMKTHGLWEVNTENWKDLRGFIDRQHNEGRHVLLWVSTLTEGLSDEEKTSNGMHNLDSEKYRERLKQYAYKMLSSDDGCYNADGIKFDFTALLPNKPDCSHYGVGYILERFKMVYNAMKQVKPDAMILNQSANPYFTPYQSAIRLNDYTAQPMFGLEEMEIRSKIAKAVGMGLPIDPDHTACTFTDYADSHDFYKNMEKLGCVSLYINEEDLKDTELLEILKGLVQRNLLRGK